MMIFDGQSWREPLATEKAAGRDRVQRMAEKMYLNELDARKQVAERKAAGDPTVRDTRLLGLPRFEDIRSRVIEIQLRSEQKQKQLNPHL